MTAALELLTGTPTDMADTARAVAMADVVAAIANTRKKELRDGPLMDRAIEAAKATGSDGLTARINGVGQVILTNPQPKPKVVDREAFTDWLDSIGRDDLYELRWTPVLGDTGAVEALLDVVATGSVPDDIVDLIDRAVQQDVTVWLDGDVFDVLAGAVKVTADAVYCTKSAEPVPGTQVSCESQRVSVRVDKVARVEVAAQVRAALGGDA